MTQQIKSFAFLAQDLGSKWCQHQNGDSVWSGILVPGNLLSFCGIKHKGGTRTYTQNTHTHKIKIHKSKKKCY